MIGVDQETGTKTKEPLMALSTYRNGKVSQKQVVLVHVDAIYVCYGSEVHVHERINHFACYFIHF